MLSTTACISSGGSVLAGDDLSQHEWVDLVADVRRSVVRVDVSLADGHGYGTGWVAGAGLLVTNAHVVEGAQGRVGLHGDHVDGEGLVADVHRSEDLATLRSSTELPQSLDLAEADPVPGDLVRALGYPLAGPFTATEGRVIEYVDGGRFGVVGCVIRTSVNLRPGNSGGPLLNANGDVVGVVFAVQVSDGVALAQPVSSVSAVLGASARTAATCLPG